MTPKAERVVRVLVEVASLGLTAYVVWLYIPESAKIEIRGWFHRAGEVHLPDSPRKVRTELMADIIELQTFGVPERWVSA